MCDDESILYNSQFLLLLHLLQKYFWNFKDCCDACQTGIDIGKARYPCQDDLGLGPPLDKVLIDCCEDFIKSTTTIQPTTPTTTTKATTPLSSARPLYSDRDLFPCKDELKKQYLTIYILRFSIRDTLF